MVIKKCGFMFMCAAILLLLVSGCSLGTEPVSQPTLDVNAIFTQAAMTLDLQWTQTAIAAATATPTLIPSTPTITFTPTVSPTWTTTPQCYDAKFVEDVTVEDGTAMAPGQDFLKTWKIQNTGSCAWTVGFKAIFAYPTDVVDSRMNGQPVVLTTTVLPGEIVDVTVQMKAPTNIGEYSGYWRMADTNNSPFGENFFVRIVVK